MVNDFSAQIDIQNTNMILLYGAAAQKNIADFSDSTLASIKTKDTGEVGAMLTNLVVELKGFDSETDVKGFFGKARSAGKSIEKMKTKYSSVQTNIDNISSALEKHQVLLLKDIATLDRLYKMNEAYFKQLTLYIIAGEKRLGEVRETDLNKLIEQHKISGNQMDAQAVNDLANKCDRFEKKLHDLKLTRQVSIQMAPQIRMLQNNDSLLVEKIQSSLVNTIPLWKSQMVLALGISNATQAMKAQREVTEMTNELLKRNAEALKIGTVEVARESERGIVDIDTLKQTNKTLISTFDEVLQIHSTGRQKRQEAERELAVLENELKEKLLQLRA